LFEFEQRGYLKAGGFVPEVVIEHPDLVRELHREYVRAGSDAVLAFTYYGHREKLRLIGRENDLEKLNRDALKIAREVADESGTLLGGNISNTTIYKPNDPEVHKQIKNIFEEQIGWAVDAGADFILGETYSSYGEAEIALDAIKEFGNGLPAIINFAYTKDGLMDGVSLEDAGRRIEERGAAVVGLNCARGPGTIIEPLKRLRKACKIPVAAVPVTYRTSEEMPSFQSLVDIDNPERSAFPLDLDPYLCSRTQIYNFGKEADKAGAQVIGLCCGNRAFFTRSLAESLGRKPPASVYSPDMSQHYSRIKDEAHSYTSWTFKTQYVDKTHSEDS